MNSEQWTTNNKPMKKYFYFSNFYLYVWVILSVPLLASCTIRPFDVFDTPRTSKNVTGSIPDSAYFPYSSSYSTPYAAPYSSPYSSYVAPVQNYTSSRYQQKALNKTPRLVQITAPEYGPGSEQGVIELKSKSELTHKPIRLVPLPDPSPRYQPDYPPPVRREYPSYSYTPPSPDLEY